MSFTTLLIASLPLLAAVVPVAAQSCNFSTPCLTAAPCCSEFGFCGAGDSYCLGGCNPLWSHSLTSCEPEPICQSANYTFTSLDRAANVTVYDGNATAYDWTIDTGVPFLTQQDELVLTLTEANNGTGTRLSSTRYVHYGTITATMKTGKWNGVVTAFITMSNAHDEIDWEWPGNDTLHAQSNFFWLGAQNFTNGETHPVSSDTFSNYHDYTIDWQPDTLTWLIDNKPVRTLQKSQTLDPATGVYDYPTTPARVQLSIWPAGIPSDAPGTIAWSGGLINWNDPDYVAAGHFYALVKSVSIQCTPDATAPAGAVSYVYTQNASGLPGILLTNQSTVNAAAQRVALAARGPLALLAVGGFAALSGMWML